MIGDNESQEEDTYMQQEQTRETTQTLSGQQVIVLSNGYGFGRYRYFDLIKVGLILILMARMVFLVQGFLPYVPREFQLCTQPWPTLFKFWTILYVCLYKLHLFYIADQKVAPNSVRVFFTVISFIVLFVALICPLIATLLEPNLAWWINTSTQVLLCIILSIFSAYTARILVQEMSFGGLRHKINKILCMEAMMQFCVWSRIAASYTQHLVSHDGWAWVIYLNSYLVFSELIPIFVIAYQIKTRKNNKEKTR